MQVQLNANVFRAVVNVSAKDDIREYLCGFYLDVPEGKVVSTDGHRLISVPYQLISGESPTGIACVNPDGSKTGEFNAANNIYSRPPKLPPKGGTVLIDTGETGDNQATLTYFDKRGLQSGRFIVERIEGTYPDYLQIIPTVFGGKPEAIGFNAGYLWDIMKEAKKGAACRFDFVPDSPERSQIKVTVGDSDFADAVIVLMPMRL